MISAKPMAMVAISRDEFARYDPQPGAFMIYGYDTEQTLNEHSLRQMREISIKADPGALRRVATFLNEAADDLETGTRSSSWHRHAPDQLQRDLGCDLIVLSNTSPSEDEPATG